MSMDDVLCIRSDELREGPPTPGMQRRQAVAEHGIWAGVVNTEPDSASGWHHHGDHETAFFVMSGRIRIEWGPDGGRSIEARTGDFVHVPAALVHREATPGPDPCEIVLFRAGEGDSVVNVDGPT